jgi:hypothetical protein
MYVVYTVATTAPTIKLLDSLPVLISLVTKKDLTRKKREQEINHNGTPSLHPQRVPSLGTEVLNL